MNLPLKIKSTGAILMNPRGEILLQQRDDKAWLPFANHWTTLGGRIENDESADAAIKRELLEEIELAPEVTLWKAYEHTQFVDGNLVVVEQYMYVGKIDKTAEEITLNEGQALGFFKRDDLEQLPIAFGFKALFEEFFDVQPVALDYKPVVAFLLVDELGRVLLQQRDDKPGLRHAGYWTLFGGQVEAGESADDAVQREMMEELAIDVPVTFWKAYQCPVRTNPGELIVFNHVYAGAMTQNLESLTLLEGQDMRFFTYEESKEMQLAFDQHIPLLEFFAAREMAR